MKVNKVIATFAGAAVSLIAAGPAAATTGQQSFTETLRANLTPSGPVVTFSQASSGGIIGGIGTVSLYGEITLHSVHPNGGGFVSLAQTSARRYVPLDNPCETVVRVMGTFSIVASSGAFAGAKENGTFAFQELVLRDKLPNGRCGATGRLFVSLQANGVVTIP